MSVARTILAVLAVILAAAAARADEIVLRATARIAPGADAMLADIADLSGPRAEALGGIVIVPAASLNAGWTRIDLARVTAALDDRGGVAWGVLSLRGSECSVGIAAAERPKPATIEPKGPAGQPASAIGPETVRGFLAVKIAASLGVEPASLRLEFDARDGDLLSMPTAGRTIDARITGSSDRVPIRISIFEGERLIVGRAIAVGALVERQIAVTTREVRRGQVIAAGDIQAEKRWVGPALAAVPPEDVIGSAPKASLDQGQVVTTNDIQSPVVIRRGDLVTVSSISGGVLVRTTARARSAAADGDLLDLETLEPDRKQRRTFTARACGRGQAVIATASETANAENQR